MSQSHLETCIYWTSVNSWFKDFFQQSATQTNNLLCYWPTINNSIWKICPKFQVFIFRFSEVVELTYEHWAKKLLWENISTPIFPQFYDMYWIKVCCQEFWSILPGLNIRFEQSKYENPAQWLHVKNWFKVARYDKSYTLFFRMMNTNQWLSG